MKHRGSGGRNAGKHGQPACPPEIVQLLRRERIALRVTLLEAGLILGITASSMRNKESGRLKLFVCEARKLFERFRALRGGRDIHA